MNDSAFFHKQKTIFVSLKEHQSRVKEFEKKYPGKSAFDFCNWYCEKKNINLKACNSNDFVRNTRLALIALERSGWDYNKSLEVDL